MIVANTRTVTSMCTGCLQVEIKEALNTICSAQTLCAVIPQFARPCCLLAANCLQV